jgi:hypothetical protein
LNSTASRKNLQAFTDSIFQGNVDGAATQFYQFLVKIDDLTINCGDSVIEASFPDLFLGGNNSFPGETLFTNIMYNLGFQFTDIMTLIFVDPSNTDPFWYYVFFRVGDFLIRLVYRDNTT